MKIYVNVDSRQLQTAVGDSRQVSSLSFKRGDGASVEIIFVRDGAQVELTTGSIVTFGAKLAGKYDANALVLENGFTLTGSGTTASYVGAPSFNTEDLDAALEKDGDDTNDVPYLDLMGEISWTDGPTGEPTSTDTFTVRVNNDVLRGDEGTPLASQTPDEWLEERRPAATISVSAPQNGTLQRESITVTGTATVTGMYKVTITGVDLGTASPVEKLVTFASGANAAACATAILAELEADTVLTAVFNFDRASNVVYIQRKVDAALDSTMNMALANEDGGGINSVATSTLESHTAGTSGKLGQMIIVSADSVYICISEQPTFAWTPFVSI